MGNWSKQHYLCIMLFKEIKHCIYWSMLVTMSYPFPPLTVSLITYDRIHELERTLTALADNLTYAGELRWLISDDSTGGDYLKAIKALPVVKAHKMKVISTQQRSGWGANANWLNAHIDTDYQFFVEDDYVLSKPLDLTVGVALMETKPHLGYLRYRGTAGDTPVFHQFEARIGDKIPGYREGVPMVAGRLTYLQFDGNSPTLYIYSHGAQLKHKRFHDYYGAYPVGLKLGETEEHFAHIVKAKMQADPDNAPACVILPEWIPMFFDHIGKSRQLTELDI